MEKAVADPCGDTIPKGLFGSNEGLIGRFKSTVATGCLTSNDGSGYVLWCPTMHNSGAQGDGTALHSSNLFMFNSGTNGTAAAPNTVANPYGVDPIGTINRASSQADPAFAFVDDALCQEARTLSACLSLVYTGRADEAAGQICIVQDFPFDLLEGDGTVNVNSLFDYSSKSARLGTDKFEVVFRPDAAHQDFYAADTDDYYHTGVAGTSPSAQHGVSREAPRLMGFAWRATETDIGSRIIVEATKNIEWKPAPLQGMVLPAHTASGVRVEDVTRSLDQKVPGWSTRLISSAGNALSSGANALLQGATSFAASRAGSMLLGEVESFIEAAPLLLL